LTSYASSLPDCEDINGVNNRDTMELAIQTCEKISGGTYYCQR
jgi:hypothetical protein